MVLAHIRIRKSALAWSLRAKPAHSHLAATATRKQNWHAALGSRQSGPSLAAAILARQLSHALGSSQSHTACPRLRSASSHGRACRHRWPHTANSGQTCMCASRFCVAALSLLVSPIPFPAELRYKPGMSHVSLPAALLHTVGAQGRCRGGRQHEPIRVRVLLATAKGAHSPSTLRRRANPALKRNANSAACRPSSAGPYGPFCARCPARHAVGVRLALR